MHSYELYDLVALNNNEAAVVIAVGNEKLIVIDHSDDRKEGRKEGRKKNM